MKKYFKIIRAAVLFVLSLSSLASCGSDEMDINVIYDITPVACRIQVVDANGNNLLNSIAENALDTSKVVAVYKGVEYPCKPDPWLDYESKAIPASFYGLILVNRKNITGPALLFGEFNGAKSYTNEEIVIKWGDGTSDTIKFDRQFKWNKNQMPTIKHEWYLNGVKQSDDEFFIINIVR